MTVPEASEMPEPRSGGPTGRDQDRPLAGITVVSLEQAVAAPLASARLAEAGARVVKVERPGGDFARGYDAAANGASSYFAWLNAGKESIVLDLAIADDVALMNRLIARCDVFIQNLAVGAIERLGFGAERLRRRHPSLIVCDISGYGRHGPMVGHKAYDLLVQAESGLLSVSGPPGPLGRVGVSVVDIGTGMNAAMAIMTALYRRERTGMGAHLQVSLFDSIAEWMTVPLLHHDYLGAAPERAGMSHPSIAPYGAFDLADGSTVLISVQSDREWRTLCEEVIDRPESCEAPDFARNVDRVRNRAATDRMVADALASLDPESVTTRLAASRIAFGRVNDVNGLSQHPQLRRVSLEVPTDDGTTFAELPAPPVDADWSPADRERRVPAVDEHGTAIRAEFAR